MVPAPSFPFRFPAALQHCRRIYIIGKSYQNIQTIDLIALRDAPQIVAIPVRLAGGGRMSAPIGSNCAVWDAAEAREIIVALAGLEGPALPILHELQAHFGFVPPQAIDIISDVLNISRAEVHGIITFYHDFRTVPPPRRVVRLCRAEACQAQGCEDLVAALRHDHGIAVDEGTAELAVETVYCLGNCALGPSAMVGGELIGRLDTARLAELCGLVETAR
jgi:formate dehydrogenase subunit gamma